MKLRQKAFLALVLIVNAALWAIPSNVALLVSSDRPTLLNRYSREHFALNVGVLLLSMVSLYIDQSRTPRAYRRRWFFAIASAAVLIPELVIADVILRRVYPPGFVEDSVAYHRKPDTAFALEVIDKPEAARSYRNAPEGFPRFHCDLHTDHHGYRNASVPQRCDIVVLGDSFAEGSHVTDEHAWPVRLAKQTGRSVYNLGMSGYSPVHYAAALRQTGLGLRPQTVLCMVYEGNDFRTAKIDKGETHPGLGRRLQTCLKRSPLRAGIDALCLKLFEHVGAAGDVPNGDMLSWLPLRVPAGPNGRFYSFAPKQLDQACEDAFAFSHDPVWEDARAILEGIHEACDSAGCRLVIVFAPTKAHVTLPLATDRLPPEQLRAFVALDSSRSLPEAAKFVPFVLERLDARETVVRDWCASKKIEFVSLTQPLRDAAAAGRQVYFTYDQHWTPEGHEVAARALYASCQHDGTASPTN